MVISKGNYPLKAGLNSCKLPAAGWTRMGGLNWRSCLGIWHESSGLIGASLIYFNIVPWNIKELPFEELSSATLKSALYHSLIGGFKHVLFSIYNVWMSSFPLTKSIIFQDGSHLCANFEQVEYRSQDQVGLQAFSHFVILGRFFGIVL